RTIRFHYLAGHLLNRIENAREQDVLVNHYSLDADSRGAITKQVLGGGLQSFTFKPEGKGVFTVTDKRDKGYSMTYHFPTPKPPSLKSALPSKIVDAVGKALRYPEYNEQGEVKKQISRAGHITRFIYDADPAAGGRTDPGPRSLGNLRQIKVQTSKDLLSSVNAAIDKFPADIKARFRSEVKEHIGDQQKVLTRTWVMTYYEKHNNLFEITGPWKGETSIQRNDFGDPVITTLPEVKAVKTRMGKATEEPAMRFLRPNIHRGFNRAGQQLWETDAAGRQTRYAYYKIRKPKKLILVGGFFENESDINPVPPDVPHPTLESHTDLSYPLSGYLAKAVSVADETVGFSRDDLGRTIETINGLGIVSKLTYIVYGELVETIQAIKRLAGHPSSLEKKKAEEAASEIKSLNIRTRHVFDADGNTRQYRFRKRDGGTILRKVEYNPLSQPTKVELRDGKSGWIFRDLGYDDSGNLDKIIVSGEGANNRFVINRVFNNRNQLFEERRGSDLIFQWTYDPDGNRATEKKGDNLASVIATDGFGRIIGVLLPTGAMSVSSFWATSGGYRIQRTTIGFDGQLAVGSNPPDQSPFVSGNKRGEVTELAVVHQLVNKLGWHVGATNFSNPKQAAGALVTSRAYYTDGQLARVVVDGRVMYAKNYNRQGRLEDYMRPGQPNTHHVWDSAGNLYQKSLLGSAKVTVTSKSDALGRQVFYSHPSGMKIRLDRDLRGNIVKKTGPKSQVITYQFNNLDQQVEARAGGVLLRRSTYAANGRVATRRGATRLDDKSTTSSWTYRSSGLLGKMTRPGKQPYVLTYEKTTGTGQIDNIRDPRNVTLSLTWDDGGWVRSRKASDSKGAKAPAQYFVRDGLGRVTFSFEQGRSLEQRGYDGLGRVNMDQTWVVQSGGKSKWVHRRVDQIHDGILGSITQSFSTSNSEVKTEFDAEGHLDHVTFSDVRKKLRLSRVFVNFGVNARGLLSEIKYGGARGENAAATSTLHYDTFKRVEKLVVAYNGPTFTANRKYHEKTGFLKRTDHKLEGTKTADFTYNAIGQLTSSVQELEFSARHPQRVLRVNTAVTRTYDDSRNLATQLLVRRMVEDRVEGERGKKHVLTSFTSTNSNQTYSSNTLNSYTRIDGINTVVHRGKVDGEITSLTSIQNNSSTATFDYDDAGNLTVYKSPPVTFANCEVNDSYTFSWDQYNRLERVDRTLHEHSVDLEGKRVCVRKKAISKYAYGASGRRLRKNVDLTVRFTRPSDGQEVLKFEVAGPEFATWFGTRVLEETNDFRLKVSRFSFEKRRTVVVARRRIRRLKQFVWAGNQHVGYIRRFFNKNDDLTSATFLKERDPKDVCYVVRDDSNQPLVLIDAIGGVAETYAVTTSGELLGTITKGTLWGRETFKTMGYDYLMAGKKYDFDTGLYYMRNRYYVPALGRFASVDPLGIWGDSASGGNGYAYAANNPANFSDQGGQSVLVIVGAVVKGYATAFLFDIAVQAGYQVFWTGKWTGIDFERAHVSGVIGAATLGFGGYLNALKTPVARFAAHVAFEGTLGTVADNQLFGIPLAEAAVVNYSAAALHAGLHVRAATRRGVPGKFGAEDVAFGLTSVERQPGNLVRFAGEATLGTRAPLSKATRGLASGTRRNLAIAAETVDFAGKTLQRTGGRLRFNVTGFDVRQALTLGSRHFNSVTSAELRGVLQDAVLRGKTDFFRRGVDVTEEILRAGLR
ncbi:RHS repeat-associated core domain-containing protein, partial [bacterium AH-315-M10]|nr:RHS repeat-associated core domain-containing protein [bacterium AH-315-M10]